MKSFFILLSFLCLAKLSVSQSDTTVVLDTNTYRFIKTDGGELIGKIMSQDARELYILTSDNRKIYIPQHIIKDMVLVKSSDFKSNGDFIGEDKFATRYFITTNGLPIVKGEHYVQWNLFGPDFQFGLGKNLGVGVMTSWLGTPVIGTIKKSWTIGEKTQFAVGGLLGTGSWVAPEWGGALPFGTLSFGNRSKNLAVSAGYGAIWQDGDLNGRALTSIAGMVKVSTKLSLVFDSFFLLPGKTETVTYYDDEWIIDPSTGQGSLQTVSTTIESRDPGFSLIIPGVRWHQAEGKAFQFGFSGVITDDRVTPVPMVQWYRSL